jgi:hypothetical protein
MGFQTLLKLTLYLVVVLKDHDFYFPNFNIVLLSSILT